MKLLILLLFPMLSFAQEIQIKNVTFKQVASTLIDEGFSPTSLNEDLGYIKTDWSRACHDCVPDMYITVRIKDSVAYLTGEWRTNAGLRIRGPRMDPNSSRVYQHPIENKGPEVARMCYLRLQTIASLIKQ